MQARTQKKIGKGKSGYFSNSLLNVRVHTLHRLAAFSHTQNKEPQKNLDIKCKVNASSSYIFV